jgi:hypothetical protein
MRELNLRIANLSPAKRAVLNHRLHGLGNKAAVSPRIQLGPIRLSFSQERLWFLDQLEPNSPVYNIPLGLRIKGTLNVPMLPGAWKRSCGATNRFGHASKRLTGARCK